MVMKHFKQFWTIWTHSKLKGIQNSVENFRWFWTLWTNFQTNIGGKGNKIPWKLAEFRVSSLCPLPPPPAASAAAAFAFHRHQHVNTCLILSLNVEAGPNQAGKSGSCFFSPSAACSVDLDLALRGLLEHFCLFFHLFARERNLDQLKIKTGIPSLPSQLIPPSQLEWPQRSVTLETCKPLRTAMIRGTFELLLILRIVCLIHSLACSALSSLRGKGQKNLYFLGGLRESIHDWMFSSSHISFPNISNFKSVFSEDH